MNYGIVMYILGFVLKIEGAFLLLPFGVGIIYGENEKWSYLIFSIVCFALGMLITAKKPKNKTMYTKEGFAIVALGWIVMSAFGAMPFVLSGDIPSYIDALFETISGFTTTEASVLCDVESLSYASIFWRSFTHWIGGMGVFVFIAAVLPMMGSSTMHLMKAESPGPSVSNWFHMLRILLLFCILFIFLLP